MPSARIRQLTLIAILFFAVAAHAYDHHFVLTERRAAPSAAAVQVPQPASNPSKIDALLRMALREPFFHERVQSFKRADGVPLLFAVERASDDTLIIPLFIRTRDVQATREAVAALHGTISTVVKSVIIARVPPSAVEALAAREEIERIEPSYPQKFALDVSRPEVKADQVQTGSGLPTGYTGRGVIVGVVDSGIDWSHSDFKNSSGQTRILNIWDQTTAGRAPVGFDRGYECTSTDINVAACPERDTNGHGTHVSGIAAGNGRSRFGGPFTGMAPEADLIVVKADPPNSTNVTDGVNYIMQKAQSLGKPVVVNLSLGGHAGPHDGSSSYEQALASLLAPGRLIVTANGNEGGDRIHLGYDAEGTSYQSGISTFWDINKGSSVSAIDMWYDSGTISAGIQANVVVNGQLKAVFNTGAISSGNLDRKPVTNSGTTLGYVTIATETTASGARHLFVLIDDNDDTSIDLSSVAWEFYTYGFGHLDAWVPVGGSFSDVSNPSLGYVAGDMNETVLMPASARNMIAVGSYTTKTNWNDVDGRPEQYSSPNPLGQISSFSSLGPTRDGRRRPIVCAPGEGIASALSTAVDATDPNHRTYFLSGGSYQIMQGTSQATPHVTGIVALMMQAKNTLTVSDAYAILRGDARKDSFTGSSPNNTYGDGKVDALAYTKEVAGSATALPRHRSVRH